VLTLAIDELLNLLTVMDTISIGVDLQDAPPDVRNRVQQSDYKAALVTLLRDRGTLEGERPVGLQLIPWRDIESRVNASGHG